ncbi:acyl-ACP--UDP-N-acetylglucosamine O-acyltransferase [candidate division CSSED10-310 bacterium]|uniref:Acyl-[acyl-carrier-protein]--UDP-N-acetylglucosamine O-acyltransferase n=1 Tax=candidate division CSSED10-310 bacterium TaxID=2855610 RepID=A0ABV6YY33_UNCC1
MNIHETAIIAPGAKVGHNVTIGARAMVGENVEIGNNCKIEPGVIIEGWTTIGPNCHIYPYTVIGTPPQDLKFGGEETKVVIGSDNTIREFVTINRATAHGGGETTIGSHNFIMAYAHIAHDCSLGDHNILANAATLAGHIIVEDHVSIGGLSGIHQFVNLGRYAFIGGCSAVSQDILPFSLAVGNHAMIHGLNVIGLQRQGFSTERLNILKQAFRIFFRSTMNRSQAVDHIKNTFEITPDIEHLLTFIEKSSRGIAKGIKPKS